MSLLLLLILFLDSGLPLCPLCAPGLQATPGVQINFSSKSEGSRDHFLAGELGGGSQRCEGHLLFILYPFLTFWVDYHVDELPAQKIKSSFFVCLLYVNATLWDTLGFLSLFWFLTGFLEWRCREYLAGETEATFYHLGRSWHCHCVSQMTLTRGKMFFRGKSRKSGSLSLQVEGGWQKQFLLCLTRLVCLTQGSYQLWALWVLRTREAEETPGQVPLVLWNENCWWQGFFCIPSLLVVQWVYCLLRFWMRTPGPSLKQSDAQSLPSVINGDSGPGFCHHWASWRWVSGESALECLFCSGQLNPKGKQRPGSCWRRPGYSPEPRSRARSAWKCAWAGGGFVFLFLRFFF